MYVQFMFISRGISSVKSSDFSHFLKFFYYRISMSIVLRKKFKEQDVKNSKVHKA